MGIIYRKAGQVLVWLGPDLAGGANDLVGWLGTHSRSGTTSVSLNQHVFAVCILTGLFRAELFTQLWIVQKLLLSARSTFIWGSTEFIIHDVKEAYQTYVA